MCETQFEMVLFCLYSSTHVMVFKDISMINSRTACKRLPTTNTLNYLFHFHAALIVTRLSQNLDSFHVESSSSIVVLFFFICFENFEQNCSCDLRLTWKPAATGEKKTLKYVWLDFSSPTDLKCHCCCCNLIFRSFPPPFNKCMTFAASKQHLQLRVVVFFFMLLC